MDLESYTRFDDYTKARDAMFQATDTEENPWYVVDANDQRRARLDCIAHLLTVVPYVEVPHERIKLPQRKVDGQNLDPNYHYHTVPQTY